MKIDYNKEKNELLKQERGLCFDEIILLIQDVENIIDIIPNPNYVGQKIFLLNIKNCEHVVAVPFVDISEDEIFLKTAYFSRKYTKIYKQKGDKNDK